MVALTRWLSRFGSETFCSDISSTFDLIGKTEEVCFHYFAKRCTYFIIRRQNTNIKPGA